MPSRGECSRRRQHKGGHRCCSCSCCCSYHKFTLPTQYTKRRCHRRCDARSSASRPCCCKASPRELEVTGEVEVVSDVDDHHRPPSPPVARHQRPSYAAQPVAQTPPSVQVQGLQAPPPYFSQQPPQLQWNLPQQPPLHGLVVTYPPEGPAADDRNADGEEFRGYSRLCEDGLFYTLISVFPKAKIDFSV